MNNIIENEYIECKKSVSLLKEGIISLSSMLNKNNEGTLYFGLLSDGTAVGVDISSNTLRDISESISLNIKPQIVPIITYEIIDGFSIIKVYVKGNHIPYSAYGRYYIRISDIDKEMSPEVLKDMFNKSSTDLITNTKCNRTDLTFKDLKAKYYLNGLSLNEINFESNLMLKTENNEYNVLADLVSDESSFSIKVSTFLTDDKTELIKRNEYGYQSIFKSIDKVLAYIESLNETYVDLNHNIRLEKNKFDFKCFKEAFLNSIVHNKWISLVPPQVYIYKDRIEVVSTGGLPYKLSKEEFYKGKSFPINPALQKILGQLDYLEQTGHGVPLIINRYTEKAFQISDNFITVTIPFEEPFTSNKNDIKVHVSKSEKLVLDSIKENDLITIKEISLKTKLAESTVNVILKKLKDAGIVERIGANKNGYWKIAKSY